MSGTLYLAAFLTLAAAAIEPLYAIAAACLFVAAWATDQA